MGRPLIKFIVAAVWICLATLGAVFYSFQSSSAKTDIAATPAMLGGLDYIRTDVISVPVFSKATIDGYFLTRLVYTVDPAQMKKLSVPAQSLIIDEVYTYLYANPQIDFSKRENFNLDTFRNGVRDSVNKRVGEKLIAEVIIEQLDFLSREETRDRSLRRREVNRPDATPAAAH